MSGQALSQTYRPQSFDEVVGQDHIVEALKKAIQNDRIAHAYIFSGTRGTGKTSLARIFARAIGTSERDLYEMDAASNRGIDEIRALRDELHSLPFESKYKVYIVDEVHMLTKEAFNALLKTLEEPPKHVVFILATTEFEKLPDTIVSRCQAFSFKTPAAPLIKEMVARAAQKEKVSLEPAAAELIALLASGSFRDAYGILQKTLTATGQPKLTLDDVASVTGAPRSSLLLDVLAHTAKGDLGEALATVRALAEHGNDMRFVLTLLLRMVRAVLLLREAPTLKVALQDEFSEEEFAALATHAAESKERLNSKLLIHLLDADMRTGSTYIPELPIELALIEHLKH